MKKKLSISFIAVFSSLILKAQNISPDVSNQFCPNQEIEFTVTLPKAYSSISAMYGSTITVTSYSENQAKTSFKFKGKFGDVNQKQTFHITYADNTSYDFILRKGQNRELLN